MDGCMTVIYILYHRSDYGLTTERNVEASFVDFRKMS